MRSYLEKPFTKIGWWSGLSHRTTKKKTKNNKKNPH
jgi:3-deoxy-D-arabino-heptulosonate 7-phosphate (DAHP) synthase